MASCCSFPPSPPLYSRAKTPIAKFATTVPGTPPLIHHPPYLSSSSAKPICRNPPRAATSPHKYIYPDPIPEFAESETKKFMTELRKKLSKEKETFGDDLDQVIEVCSQIFRDFLRKQYGGPGTLMVEPFTDMLVALKDNKLPGAPLAARSSLLWAQNYVDQDWNEWNSNI